MAAESTAGGAGAGRRVAIGVLLVAVALWIERDRAGPRPADCEHY